MSDQGRRILGVVSAKGGSGRTLLALSLAMLYGADTWATPYGPGLTLSSHTATPIYDFGESLPAILASAAELVVVEAGWEEAFAVARLSDVVFVPTRLDMLSVRVLNRVTLPLVAAAGTPAILYVVDEGEGDLPPYAREDEEWMLATHRVGEVLYAPWRPSRASLPDSPLLEAAVDAARPIEVIESDYPTGADRSCHLYRHLAADGTLLYVGISGDPIFRFRSGHKDKAWAHQVATVDVETFPTREMARTAELIAIAKENPLHNVADRPRGYSCRDDGEWDDPLADG